ncbi:hypothetical protein TELCIR_09418, partial [Teladorsagia circumcincta]
PIMSAGLAVNRPSAGSLSFASPSSSEMATSSSSSDIQCRSPSRSNQQTQTQQSLCESDLEVRLREAIRQRDEQWRRHEREQIVFLQNETAAMLRGLHKEIERLGYQLKEYSFTLTVTYSAAKHDFLLSSKIRDLRSQKILDVGPPCFAFGTEIREKEQRASCIDSKAAETVEKLQEQINIQADRIRQLSSELNERNQTLAVLSSQLRSYRLRDAMATAQQRRRASTSPIVSPSSPHRIFPPKGLVSASVTVSYPGSQTGDRSGSVDRILRRKSASNVGMNKTN